jgi:tetratricopeptide (TPR) repeat protein
MFSVQEDIAIAVANELKLKLGVGKALKQLGGTDNLEAYDLYLIARGQAGNLKLDQALKSINNAIELDPEFTLAYTTKSYIHSLLAAFGNTSKATSELEAALNASLKAVELEPNLGLAHITLGGIFGCMGRFIEAEKSYRKGLELSTESKVFELLDYYMAVGYLRKAHELIEEAIQNDPLSPGLRRVYMFSIGCLGDIEQFEKEYQQGKAMFGDQWIVADFLITWLRLGAKDDISIKDIPATLTRAGNYEKLIASPEDFLAEMHRLFSSGYEVGGTSLVNISCFAAFFGDQKLAMDLMERSINSNKMLLQYIWLPVFQEVRQLPRFKEFARDIGLVEYWKEYGWPDLCKPFGDDDFECN